MSGHQIDRKCSKNFVHEILFQQNNLSERKPTFQLPRFFDMKLHKTQTNRWLECLDEKLQSDKTILPPKLARFSTKFRTKHNEKLFPINHIQRDKYFATSQNAMVNQEFSSDVLPEQRTNIWKLRESAEKALFLWSVRKNVRRKASSSRFFYLSNRFESICYDGSKLT